MTSDMHGGVVNVPLPVARYRFRAQVQGELRLPPYAGSLLRGAFGAALRRVACMTGLPACPACPLYRTCPYPALFETPPQPTPLPQQFSQVPNPYVVEPPASGTRRVPAGETLEFHMVLIGHEALRQLPLVVHAWQRALAHGLGRMRVPAVLREVAWCSDEGHHEPVFEESDTRLHPHDAALVVPAPPPGLTTLRLHIETPLRIQHQGHALGPQRLDTRTLILAAVRRATLMLHVHCGHDAAPDMPSVLNAAASAVDDRAGLSWQDWTRYSSRQQQEMALGGVVGQWRLAGSALAAAWPWLWLGQWLHLGKNATMGLGAYRLSTDG